MALVDSASTRHPPHSPPLPPSASAFASAVPSPPVSPTSPALRALNPAKRAVKSTASQHDLRTAATQDALREQNATRALADHPSSASPPSSPTFTEPFSSAKPLPSSARLSDPNAMMQRNASIDSTVSSLSSASATHRVNGHGTHRVHQEPSAPHDVATLLAAAGSSEAAIQKLIGEKNQAASHNAQLWRLVEKQRAMILGLNKDLEKTHKEKERYRRKLKDQLALSQPSTTPATHSLKHPPDAQPREESQSPAVSDERPSTNLSRRLRDVSVDSRNPSDASDTASLLHPRPDPQQDLSPIPPSVLPAVQPLTSASPRDQKHIASNAVPSPPSGNGVVRQPLPLNTGLPSSPRKPGFGGPASSATTPPGSATPVANPKSRKAPPAPLKLADPPMANSAVENNIIDASESEYEEDPTSARFEHLARGRRKTREEDDRQREALVREEEMQRSRSKKSKKIKSHSQGQNKGQGKHPAPAHPSHDGPAPSVVPGDVDRESATTANRPQPPPPKPDAAFHSQSAPSLMSPGLPMTPRPGDRPLNSPMPRAPNARALHSIPMSPKHGLPLSPRAPRQPIPIPSHHTSLATQAHQRGRPEPYPSTGHVASSMGHPLRPPMDGNPELERFSAPTDASSRPVGELYTGLVTEDYPSLLLPPNALPSVYIATASSRMRPSRQSFIPPKQEDSYVFTLGVHSRADHKQLWRVEKTHPALAQLDQQVKSVSTFRERIPDRVLFAGHAPAKIDARRGALDGYFRRLLDGVRDEKCGIFICAFLTTDAIGAAAHGEYQGGAAVDPRSDSPLTKMSPRREGYLTKRGKNFGGWKPRFFVLDGPVLKYYDGPGTAQLGSIKLPNAQIGKQQNSSQNGCEDEESQYRHAFLILEPKRKDSSSLVRHVLCAESDEERDAWVQALLAYVDHTSDGEDAKMDASRRPDVHLPRSPRLQKSMTDLGPASRNAPCDTLKPRAQSIRTIGYDETVAREAPVLGTMPLTPGMADSPSPPYDGNFGPAETSHAPPLISGPTNMQVISNAEDWGMKPAPAPQTRDKKRSLFAGFRGRSSSDLKDMPGSSTAASAEHVASSTGQGVFGMSLAEAVEFARPVGVDTELPAVVYRCIEYLLVKNAEAEEGIFRLSGSNTVIKGLKDQFNARGDVDLVGAAQYHDIHAVASLLKLYLRELPSTILTRELHLEFLHCLEMQGLGQTHALNVLVNQLPRPNRVLLEALSTFLFSIVDNAEVNKMNVRNGERPVFVPSLEHVLTSRSRNRLRPDAQRPRAAHLLLRPRPSHHLRPSHRRSRLPHGRARLAARPQPPAAATAAAATPRPPLSPQTNVLRPRHPQSPTTLLFVFCLLLHPRRSTRRRLRHLHHHPPNSDPQRRLRQSGRRPAVGAGLCVVGIGIHVGPDGPVRRKG